MERIKHLMEAILEPTSAGSRGTAARVDELLAHVQDILDHDDELCSRVSFSIRAKGHNDKTRLLKLRHYRGPDLDTTSLVDAQANQWREFPMLFWKGAHRYLDDAADVPEPQAMIVSQYLDAARDDA